MRLIARRLRELSERDEELLAENIALQNGTRVEEYQKRIAHLEYQLDLLKRRFGVDDASLVELPAKPTETSTLSLLIYNAHGRIFRVELNPRAVSGGNDTKEPGRITGDMMTNLEPPRMLAVPSNEDVLLLFTSGRVDTYSVNNIPTVELGGAWDWTQAALPNKPRAAPSSFCKSAAAVASRRP